MTGDQLRELRESRELTRQQLADELGDCSPSTVNKWERGISPVPGWVADKMMSKVRLELTLEDLQALLDYAREKSLNFNEVIGEALRYHINKYKHLTEVTRRAAGTVLHQHADSGVQVKLLAGLNEGPRSYGKGPAVAAEQLHALARKHRVPLKTTAPAAKQKH